MKKLLLPIFLMVMSAAQLMAQAVADTTASAPAQPSTSQKLAFYGLTGAGLVLLFLSYKQSKWGRKK